MNFLMIIYLMILKEKIKNNKIYIVKFNGELVLWIEKNLDYLLQNCEKMKI